MKLEITYSTEPTDILGCLGAEDAMMDIQVIIDGKVCPPALRDIILAGLYAQAGVAGKTFAEVAEKYLQDRYCGAV